MITGVIAALVTTSLLIGAVALWVRSIVVAQPYAPVSRIIKGAEGFVGAAAKLSRFKSGYRNNKTVWLLPTRGALPIQVYVSLRNMFWPMNTPRACLEKQGMEVGAAYEEAFTDLMKDETTKDYPFIWTYEEDNIQPQDVFLKLFDAIWTCIDCGELMPAGKDGGPADPWVCSKGHKGLDAVGALYYTKTDPPFAMAYGDPKLPGLDFRPLDMDTARAEGRVVEVNGVAMGSTLWRKKVFEGVSKPWFLTLSGEIEGAGAFTQDLYACRKLKEEKGARFAVHAGCNTGHLDVVSGRVF